MSEAMPVLLQPRLEAINQRLARLFLCEPAGLDIGAERNQRDSLVVCGILGGKDVGKSTLINALAGERVSVDVEEAGAGTTRPQVYVHADSVEQIHARFDAVGSDGPLIDSKNDKTSAASIDVFTHRADRIRDLALVDLPDFDSDFPHHFQVVRSTVPRLDRVIWVVTPRKLADRAWVDFFREVAKDAANVYYVMNKTDELLAESLAERNGGGRGIDDPASAFWEDQRDWFEGSLLEAAETNMAGRTFMLAAAFENQDALADRLAHVWDDPSWQRYKQDRHTVEKVGACLLGELVRLREAVLAPLKATEAAALKQANRTIEIHHAVAQLRRHYSLGHWNDVLNSACGAEAQQTILNSVFGPDYCTEVASRLASRQHSDLELADALFSWRAEQWPLLRIVYYPLGWLARWMGRRMDMRAHRPSRSSPEPNWFDQGFSTLEERAAAVVEQTSLEEGRLWKKFDLRPGALEPRKMSERFITRCEAMTEQLDSRLLDLAKQRYRKPGPIGIFLLVVLPIWFCLFQPVAEGVLDLWKGGAFPTLHAAYTLVKALSARHLLNGAGVAVLVYVSCLAVMYSRCVRRIRTARQRNAKGNDLPELIDDVDRALAEEILAPVFAPLSKVRDELHTLSAELEQIERS